MTLYAPGSSGDAKKAGYCLYTAFKAGTISGPAITFSSPTVDSRRKFNFCQAQDLRSVELMHDELRRINHKVPIFLHGVCLAGTLFLRYLVEQCDKARLNNVAAVIAETPAVTVPRTVAVVPGTGWLCHLLVRAAFPNYHPDQPTLLDAHKFPEEIPVLIGSLPYDRVTKRSDIAFMVTHLQQVGGRQIQHFLSCGRRQARDPRSTNVRHGRLGLADDFQQAAQQFRAQHAQLTILRRGSTPPPALAEK